MNWTESEIMILGPAMLAGLLVIATHVPLGQRVLQRGIIFLDLAVAQMAGLGVILASSLGLENGGWQVQIVAVSAAITGVLILHVTEKKWPQIQEALIGSMFVLTSSVGVLLLASHPHASEQLKDLLVGQVLWVSYAQLLPVAILYGLVLLVWFRYAQRTSSLTFYLLFALAITASVQLVGIYLVFASLILPALAIRNLQHHALAWGYAIGVAGYALGLLLSLLWDMPAGAMIVCALALSALAGGVIARRLHS